MYREYTRWLRQFSQSSETASIMSDSNTKAVELIKASLEDSATPKGVPNTFVVLGASVSKL